ncbi:type II secretion system secretin GspD [Pseudomonas lactis]|uniref:Type II secretion system secretin GspD n=1 Tax=Pseudomonas lactis TaxID=1615674 RepID=A0A7Y1LB85_9PSED|nr:type II secretion system secretin GspD [Pseudomonas lactis]NNA42857.1 type II secretion system secretin GspD [Pseudomonas lactis]
MMLCGCTTQTTDSARDNSLIKEALSGTGDDRSPLPATTPRAPPQVMMAPAAATRVIQGSQHFINKKPSAVVRPSAASQEAGITLNFANVSIQAVANTILGDVLKENYSIAPGVVGDVTFSTSKPVNKSQAFSILETLLALTKNAIVRQNDRYVVLPANMGVAGQLVPQLSLPQPGSGLTARFFLLNYISAPQMQKLLQPLARENAFVQVDAARNLLIMAGTPDELSNYQQTIDTFDVNWLQGMSVSVFGLKHANVSKLMPDLDRLFGAQSATPLAGMLRFLPIERTNSIVVISSQPQYLSDVGRWIEAIDQGGGNEPQMYVYDVRNMKATDLAKYLRQIYGNARITDEPAAQVAPGLRTVTLSSNGYGNSSDSSDETLGRSPGADVLSGNANADNSLSDTNPPQPEEESESNNESQGETENATNNETFDNSVRITAQKSSNQLLVRSRPAQWAEIESAIQRLDNPPLQVQIETRILEVSLTGSLELGVQWYLGNLAGNSTTPGVQNTTGTQGALGGGGVEVRSASLFYSFVSNNFQVALRALETSGNTKVLSAPSLVVMNNQQARIQVGNNIPISQTTINTGVSAIQTSSVQYVQTGVILNVVPRINPGGLVYMDIQQQVSDATSPTGSGNTTTPPANPTISTRSVSTQVAVQSGQTVLLGGLIKQNQTEIDRSVPYLGKIPILKWLFGTTTHNDERSELIVLITPRVITSTSEARQVTDEYRQRFQSLRPL